MDALPDAYFGGFIHWASFAAQEPLWDKEIGLEVDTIHFQKIWYHKIGKTFGLFTKRLLHVDFDTFYYSDGETYATKASCSITNVYVGCFLTKNEKFPWLIRLTNFHDNIDFYFDDEQELQKLLTVTRRHAIQINFPHNYQLKQKLGVQQVSKVKLGIRKSDGSKHAVKTIKKFDRKMRSNRLAVEREKRVFGAFLDRDFNQLEEFYQDQNNYYFVIKYIKCKNLCTLIREDYPFSFAQKMQILKGVLQALQEIHSLNIIHRDVKPQNVVIDMDRMKTRLFDFSLALIVDHKTELKDYKRCGTVGYIAPEVISNKQLKNTYDSKVDVFSFGILAHIILLGSNPLKGKSNGESFIKNKLLDFKLDQERILKKYGEEGLVFLQGVLQLKPQKRFSSKKAIECLLDLQKRLQQVQDRYSSVEKRRYSDVSRSQDPDMQSSVESNNFSPREKDKKS